MNAPLLLAPHSVEAEQALIGALLIDRNAWDRIADTISEGDFYRDDHRRIFRHIALLSNRGKTVDFVSVAESIERSNEVDQSGGLAYLAEIANATPSAANIRRYAEIVRERALMRRLITIGGELQSACYAPGSALPGEIVADAERKLASAMDETQDEPASLSQAMSEAMLYVDGRGEAGGLRTGFVEFDLLTGGLEPGQLVIVAARPSVGKTLFACNVADQVANAGKAAMIFTLEMSRREIGMRILSSRSSVPVHTMRSGTKHEEDWNRMSAVMPSAAQQRLWIDDKPAATVAYIRARAKRTMRAKGLDLVIVDYLGLMRGQGENRVQEIGSISRGLKAMAKELGVPVICLAQLNRGVEARPDKRPIMSDLRDSGEVEQDADIVAMLHRESLYSDSREWDQFAELIVRKNRNGPLGDVPLHFDGRRMTFSAWSGSSPRTAATATAAVRGAQRGRFKGES